MSETVLLPKPVGELDVTAVGVAPLTAVALTSFAALLLELALTRVFSVVLFYHFAFLAISVALLGLGAGGVVAHLKRERLAKVSSRKIGAVVCVINALAIVIALEVLLHLRISLQLSGHNFKRLTAIYVSSALPFFFTGLLFSVVFAREPRRIPQLYGADLVGGALACLAVVPLLNWIGGPNAILFAGAVWAAASVVWSVSSRLRLWSAGICGFLLALIAANASGRLIDVIYAKGLRISDRAEVEYVRWNAISRVEVDHFYDGSRWVVIDADANSALINLDPQTWQSAALRRQLMNAPPAVANVLRPGGDFAIIGPGGGVDVLRAIANGSPQVTGIEINPIIVNDVMKERYAAYTYHLYDMPQVHVHIADGRSWIRSTRQTFDVVQMTLVDTWASTAAGAFALSENNLYTVEALRAYFNHLRPDGLIAITRWEFKRPREALRVVSVAMEALHQLGVRDTSGNFIVVSDGPLDEDGRPVVVLAKKSAFTAEEETAVRAHLAQTTLVAQYLPSQPSENPFGRLIASNDPYSFASRYEFNVAPVTDNNPFFFFTLKTGQILNRKALHRGMDWKVNLGVVVLGMVLLISAAAVLLFLVLPLSVQGGNVGNISRLFYFIAVGLGYILVEIAFIQRFVLFLGHPTYALTVVIFLLLLSSGAGSLVSHRWLRSPRQVWLPLVLISGLLLALILLLPIVLSTLVGLPFDVKLIISAALLVPLGFLMGMPFPTGLRWLASGNNGLSDSFAAIEAVRNDSAVEWAWAMNAASSVLGSVLAIVIAVHLGLNVTLACGAAAYLAALACTRTFRQSSLAGA